jgi:hypothetical protein
MNINPLIWLPISLFVLGCTGLFSVGLVSKRKKRLQLLEEALRIADEQKEDQGARVVPPDLLRARAMLEQSKIRFDLLMQLRTYIGPAELIRLMDAPITHLQRLLLTNQMEGRRKLREKPAATERKPRNE